MRFHKWYGYNMCSAFRNLTPDLTLALAQYLVPDPMSAQVYDLIQHLIINHHGCAP